MEEPKGFSESTLDVYAKPYVPQALRDLNDAPAQPIPCSSPPWIDFQRYVQSFSGSLFMTAFSRPPCVPAEHSTLITFDGELDVPTYSAYFFAAVSAEIKALQAELKDFDLYQVALPHAQDPHQSTYLLGVPGLREASLRIEVGDVVQLRQVRFDMNGNVRKPLMLQDRHGQRLQNAVEKRYDSRVCNIDRLRETLTLQVDSLSQLSPFFNARFTVQNDRMDALQRAVTGAQQHLTSTANEWMRSMLFPLPTDGVLQRTLNSGMNDISAHDPLLNYEQVKAISTFLKASFGRVPYLVSGPPGTGKTKTVVELTLQLLKRDPAARLLLCAPSDSACDTLVQRLSKFLMPKELFRLNSPARSFPEVPESILHYCFIDGTIFSLLPFHELLKRKVVVVTCRDAELLHRARCSNRDLFFLEHNMHSVLHPESASIIPLLHWSGLIVDEAAQATEPETLIPLLAVAPPEGMFPDSIASPGVALVGDKNQLGPRTASKAAMQTSLFERLLSRPLYSDHPLARHQQSGGVIKRLTQDMLPIIRPPFTDLIRNYRSHPGILAIPSSLFYNDTLEPSADNVDSLLSWSGFQGRSNMPVLFVTNQAHDEIERDGGGWYNVGEARQALQCARSFMEQNLLQQHQICIMSPFRAQVRLLRLFAREPSMGLGGVNIGPLEAYQGLEFKLVIVCTTRTRDRFIDQDLARGLGVIHESRRFNVALTRAMQGLIVIGNPVVLSQDENWAGFMAFCRRNGAWRGTDGDDWQTPHSQKIKMSRLEKQIQFSTEMESGVKGLDGRMRQLGLTVSEDDVRYESGVAAEETLKEEQYDDEGEDEGGEDTAEDVENEDQSANRKPDPVVGG